MKDENIGENTALVLTMSFDSKKNKHVRDLDLHSWLREWLIQDYEITIEKCWWVPPGLPAYTGTFTLSIPLKQINPSKLDDVIHCSSPNSYPQTKNGSDFKIIGKALSTTAIN